MWQLVWKIVWIAKLNSAGTTEIFFFEKKILGKLVLEIFFYTVRYQLLYFDTTINEIVKKTRYSCIRWLYT